MPLKETKIKWEAIKTPYKGQIIQFGAQEMESSATKMPSREISTKLEETEIRSVVMKTQPGETTMALQETEMLLRVTRTIF